MTAITIVEIIGVLRIGVDSATIFILVPLIACNAFQILMLHRVLVSHNRTIAIMLKTPPLCIQPGRRGFGIACGERLE